MTGVSKKSGKLWLSLYQTSFIPFRAWRSSQLVSATATPHPIAQVKRVSPNPLTGATLATNQTPKLADAQ